MIFILKHLFNRWCFCHVSDVFKLFFGLLWNHAYMLPISSCTCNLLQTDVWLGFAVSLLSELCIPWSWSLVLMPWNLRLPKLAEDLVVTVIWVLFHRTYFSLSVNISNLGVLISHSQTHSVQTFDRICCFLWIFIFSCIHIFWWKAFCVNK